ncbi:ribonuclease HII [bacterium 3DAC]|jgi:ribonuclease HII|nr:ribonuclease HII [Dictyoglomota bacterium]UZN23105.1 ribonuclease HII [bacterium 3DAC]
MDFSIERRYLEKGFRLVGGVDEVGRGAVAGPLFVGLAIFTKPYDMMDIFWTDSKMFSSEKKRRQIFMRLINIPGFLWTVGWVDAWEIDEKGIMWALGEALNRALDKLHETYRPTLLLTDGKVPFPGIAIPQRTLIKGDRKSPSIAAASIVAKVIRDIYVASIGELLDYGVVSNKGYGTKAHMGKIKELGMSRWHRKSFLKKLREEGGGYG